MIDYYSGWIEVAPLDQPTANVMTQHTSSIFIYHGTPEVVISDNGPQYTSEEYASISIKKHVTSSSYNAF